MDKSLEMEKWEKRGKFEEKVEKKKSRFRAFATRAKKKKG